MKRILYSLCVLGIGFVLASCDKPNDEGETYDVPTLAEIETALGNNYLITIETSTNTSTNQITIAFDGTWQFVQISEGSAYLFDDSNAFVLDLESETKIVTPYYAVELITNVYFNYVLGWSGGFNDYYEEGPATVLGRQAIILSYHMNLGGNSYSVEYYMDVETKICLKVMYSLNGGGISSQVNFEVTAFQRGSVDLTEYTAYESVS